MSKDEVRQFWSEASCGEELYLVASDTEGYRRQSAKRYELEPYIPQFAGFKQSGGKRVLEIGVGLGADHQSFAEAGAILTGIDLTERAIRHCRERFALVGLQSDLRVGDAEALGLPNGEFDLVYSWGVIHHSPNTAAAVLEIQRVLKPGGTARIMIYHKWSMVGVMLWLRYGLLRLRPTIPWVELYDRYLESPGTKAYTPEEARRLFQGFSSLKVWTQLTHADLLTSAAGQRHRGALQSIARRLWPRWLVARCFAGWGLFLMIEAVK